MLALPHGVLLNESVGSKNNQLEASDSVSKKFVYLEFIHSIQFFWNQHSEQNRSNQMRGHEKLVSKMMHFV